jgi:hypothetical protein
MLGKRFMITGEQASYPDEFQRLLMDGGLTDER